MRYCVDNRTEAQSPHEGRRILIVDDDDDYLDLLRSHLVWAGIPCAVARNVEEACALLISEGFDLLLLDWKLEKTTLTNLGQGRTGAEVLRLSRELYPLMPVIVMTSIPTSVLDVRTDALLAEADSFLEKGFSRALMAAHIQRWFKRSE